MALAATLERFRAVSCATPRLGRKLRSTQWHTGETHEPCNATLHVRHHAPPLHARYRRSGTDRRRQHHQAQLRREDQPTAGHHLTAADGPCLPRKRRRLWRHQVQWWRLELYRRWLWRRQEPSGQGRLRLRGSRREGHRRRQPGRRPERAGRSLHLQPHGDADPPLLTTCPQGVPNFPVLRETCTTQGLTAPARNRCARLPKGDTTQLFVLYTFLTF